MQRRRRRDEGRAGSGLLIPVLGGKTLADQQELRTLNDAVCGVSPRPFQTCFLTVSVLVSALRAVVPSVEGLKLEQSELTKAIVGTMGDLDSYQLPDSKGYTSLMRHLLKVGDEERQQRREEVNTLFNKLFYTQPLILKILR